MKLSTTRTWNVLIVDDNDGDINLFRMSAANVRSVALHVAENAVQAQQYILGRPPYAHLPLPDLIVLDLNMPIFKGFEVLRLLQERADMKIPVVVFTSSRSVAEMKKCRDMGAADVVVKPNDWPTWQAVVHKLLVDHLPGASCDDSGLIPV